MDDADVRPLVTARTGSAVDCEALSDLARGKLDPDAASSRWTSRRARGAVARVHLAPSLTLAPGVKTPSRRVKPDGSRGAMFDGMKTFLEKRAWVLLIAGAALIALAHVRFSIGALAWFAPVPFLHYLRLRSGWKGNVAFLAATLAGWTLAFLKITTAPIPAGLAFGFSIPLAFFLGAPYLGWAWARRRLRPELAVLFFPALMVSSEWVQHTFTPFASWGAAGYTQLDNLPLLQLASIAGLAGPGFVVYGLASALEEVLASGFQRSRRIALTAVAVVVAAHAFGGFRLAIAGDRAEPTVLVAAVRTDSTISGLPLPSLEESAAWDEALFARTERAAASGAKLVVWPEAATLVRPEDEPAWIERARTRARRAGVDVVVAYVVPLSLEPLRYANRYRMIRSDGTVDHTYHKHHPVPGEPCEPGTEPVPVSLTSYGRVSGAICYDYDFPRIGLGHSRSGIDLVALPSSDWRGIDPIHTQMASVRAIEGGHSVLRSTRWGLSAGIDHHGRIRAWSSHFDDGDGLLFARLPQRGVSTVYGRLGDWLVLVSSLFTLLAVVFPRPGREERREAVTAAVA